MREINFNENTIVGRIWFEIENLTRHGIEWEWMSEMPHGEYLRRDDVLEVIGKHLASAAQTDSEG